jgi:hypothetical protein
MLTKRVHGPLAPSKLALMGIRFVEGEDGNAPAAPETPVAPAEAPKPEAPAQDLTDWKAEARKWEGRAKDNSTAADRLKEIEDAAKTDLEKEREARTKAEQTAAEKDAELAKYRVAAKHGISEKEMKLLTGKTEADLEEQAAAILDVRGPAQPAVPKPDPSVGPKEPAKPSGLAGAISAHYEAN